MCYTVAGWIYQLMNLNFMEEETKTCDNCEACAGGCSMHEGATDAPATEEAPSEEAAA